MSTSTSTMASPPQAAAKPDKTKVKRKIIVLKLSPASLAKFVPKSSPSDTKSSASSPSTPDVPIDEQPTIKKTTSSSNENQSEANSTPAPPTDAPTPVDGPPKKRKGPMPGTKRGPLLGPDGLPKPRGKPGPKKKPRLEDGTIDHSATKPSTGVPTGVGAHKLGPKANQGAINAGLRALDRSGKPCRKWNRKPFQLKSFTGVIWDIPSWGAPAKPAFLNGDADREMNGLSQQSSSDVKPNDSSTAMESNGPEQLDPMVLSTPAASSPIPTPAALIAQG